MGFVEWFFGNNRASSAVNRYSIPKTSIVEKMPVISPTYNLAKPLPFKTIAQQQSEFIPTYKTERQIRSAGKFPHAGTIEAQAAIQANLEAGYKLFEVQQVTRRGKPYGIYLNFDRYTTTQTNVFNPRLTRI